MLIKNKATGQVFEVAEGALYPKNSYVEVKEPKEESKVNPEPYIETPIAPEQAPEPVKKAKKTRKRVRKAKKTTE